MVLRLFNYIMQFFIPFYIKFFKNIVLTLYDIFYYTIMCRKCTIDIN